MTLEERCIASKRLQMATADANKLTSLWKSIQTVKGGNEHGEFETTLRRDIVAYTLLKAVEWRGGSAFGGFVRSHVSGKPWKDIDVLMTTKDNPEEVWKAMMKVLFFTLPIRKNKIRDRIASNHAPLTNGYARTYVLQLIDHNIEINVDIVNVESINRSARIPVTIGSCLSMSDGRIELRNIRSLRDRLAWWKVEEIQELLRNGEDIKLCYDVASSSLAYSEYYWRRIHALEKMWKLDAVPLGVEPPKVTQSSSES